MTFKNRYSRKELDEVSQWLKEHKNELPHEMELYRGEVCKDVPRMVEHLLIMAEVHGDNSVFSGELAYLFLIRERLEAQNEIK